MALNISTGIKLERIEECVSGDEIYS